MAGESKGREPPAIEAELKARVLAPEETLRRLDECATDVPEVYRDTYDDAAEVFLRRDAELRVRTGHGPGDTRAVLTYRGAAVDEASGPKPEH